MEAISLMIHVVAAAILVGPQVLMFYAVTPATWLIGEERLKRDVVKVVASRFAKLAIGSLVILLVTGLYQYYSIVPEAIQEDIFAYRFGEIFVLKMTLVTVLLALIVVHGAVLARRIGRMSDEVIAGRGDTGALESARMQTLLFSGIMVIVSLAILMLGAVLGHHEFVYIAK